MTEKTTVAIIGTGAMARYHIHRMLKQPETTHITVVCEPSHDQYKATAQVFEEAGLEPPPNQPDLNKLLSAHKPDTAFIVTPHAYHHDQTKACLETGLDVLLEKPMVMNATEARSLIETRNRTSKLLVIAFPGSLSPRIRKASLMAQANHFGPLLSISATVWQNWGPGTVNSWRQQPELSGGGFLFDTGAHMLNTVVDLAGEEFAEVSAWLDNRGRPVETMGVIIGRLKSGVLVTMHACGEAIPSCSSDIRFFYSKTIVRCGMWGEYLEIQRAGRNKARALPVPPSLGVWEQFLAVRAGKIPNPGPPEVGLRMAYLYDAIKSSAFNNGVITRVGNLNS